MASMEWENKITMGNVLTIAITVATIVAGYTRIQAEQSYQADRIAALERESRERVQALTVQQAAQDTRIRGVELMQAGQSSDLRNIQTGIDEIKAALERLTTSK